MAYLEDNQLYGYGQQTGYRLSAVHGLDAGDGADFEDVYNNFQRRYTTADVIWATDCYGENECAHVIAAARDGMLAYFVVDGETGRIVKCSLLQLLTSMVPDPHSDEANAVEPHRVPHVTSTLAWLSVTPTGTAELAFSHEYSDSVYTVTVPRRRPYRTDSVVEGFACGETITELGSHEGSVVATVATSRNGRYVCSGDENGVVRVWHMDIQPLLHKIHVYNGSTVTALAMNNDWVAVGGLDNYVRLASVRTGQVTVELPMESVRVTSIKMFSRPSLPSSMMRHFYDDAGGDGSDDDDDDNLGSAIVLVGNVVGTLYAFSSDRSQLLYYLNLPDAEHRISCLCGLENGLGAVSVCDEDGGVHDHYAESGVRHLHRAKSYDTGTFVVACQQNADETVMVGFRSDGRVEVIPVSSVDGNKQPMWSQSAVATDQPVSIINRAAGPSVDDLEDVTSDIFEFANQIPFSRPEHLVDRNASFATSNTSANNTSTTAPSVHDDDGLEIEEIPLREDTAADRDDDSSAGSESAPRPLQRTPMSHAQTAPRISPELERRLLEDEEPKRQAPQPSPLPKRVLPMKNPNYGNPERIHALKSRSTGPSSVASTHVLAKPDILSMQVVEQRLVNLVPGGNVESHAVKSIVDAETKRWSGASNAAVNVSPDQNVRYNDLCPLDRSSDDIEVENDRKKLLKAARTCPKSQVMSLPIPHIRRPGAWSTVYPCGDPRLRTSADSTLADRDASRMAALCADVFAINDWTLEYFEQYPDSIM